MYKQLKKYFKKNPTYNSIVHIIGGMGIGILMVYPIVGPHPMRWGIGMILLAVLGYLWALVV